MNRLTDKQVAAGLTVARFPSLNKQDNILDYTSQLPHTPTEPVKVVETVKLTGGEYRDFCRNLLTDRDWLAGKGGTESLAELELSDRADWLAMDDEQRQAWRAEAYRLCIAVTAPDYRTLYVDPQGYDYARYVGF